MKKIYCNPLPIPSIPIGRGALNKNYEGTWWREFGDPSVIKHNNRWYLFPSCGMIWWSDNMVDWVHQEINISDVGWAPSVTIKDGIFYLTASWEGSCIWRADDPLGHWENIGEICDHTGANLRWGDPDLFTDDDGSMYAYYSIGANKGVYGVKLVDKDPTKFSTPATHLIAYNPQHTWERFGECNQDPSISHLEGASMTKHNGRYYLQYSAAGAEWRNYAVGCYVSEHPLGPFTYQNHNPILIHRGGMINGCGHNCIVEGPDDTLWCFYTILMRRFHALERRIGMDPVLFDEMGEMVIDGPSESPRFLDGSYPKDILPVTICQGAKASSFTPGHEPECGVDNYIRTWWEAEGNRHPQWLEVDLDGEYDVSSARILFSEQCTKDPKAEAIWRFKIEVSSQSSGSNWEMICNLLDTNFDGHIRFVEFQEKEARRLRITIMENPCGSTPGIMDFCVFGKIKQ